MQQWKPLKYMYAKCLKFRCFFLNYLPAQTIMQHTQISCNIRQVANLELLKQFYRIETLAFRKMHS